MRGQSAAELILVFSVGLIVLTAIYLNSQEQLSGVQSSQAFSQASKSASDLASAADEVYFEGVGAKKKVLVTIPDSIIASTITANSIRITVGIGIGQNLTSDASAYVDHPLCTDSSLPTTPGTHEVYVTATSDGCVTIGTASGLSVEPTLLYVSEFTNTTTRTVFKNLTFTNLDSSSMSVNVSVNWDAAYGASIVNVSLNNTDDIGFTLAAGASKNVTLNVTLYPPAYGAYAGNVTANSSAGDIIASEVVVEVSPAVCEAAHCNPASNVSVITIELFKNQSYTAPKYIFSPSENVTFTGTGWDSDIYVLVNVSYSNGTQIGPPYPRNELTNSTGGFKDTKFRTAGFVPDTFTINVTGPVGGVNTTKTATVDLVACTT